MASDETFHYPEFFFLLLCNLVVEVLVDLAPPAQGVHTTNSDQLESVFAILSCDVFHCSPTLLLTTSFGVGMSIISSCHCRQKPSCFSLPVVSLFSRANAIRLFLKRDTQPVHSFGFILS